MRKIKNSRWRAEDLTPLASLRFKAGYARDQAAVSMQISNTTLFNYENGIKDIPFSIVNRMTELYNVSIEDIRQAILATQKEAQEQSSSKNTFTKLKDREVLKKAIEIADSFKEAALS